MGLAHPIFTSDCRLVVLSVPFAGVGLAAAAVSVGVAVAVVGLVLVVSVAMTLIGLLYGRIGDRHGRRLRQLSRRLRRAVCLVRLPVALAVVGGRRHGHRRHA